MFLSSHYSCVKERSCDSRIVFFAGRHRPAGKIIREECRYLLENHSKTARENREELAKSLGAFRTENAESLKHIAEQNFQSLETVRRTLDSSFQEFRKIFTENIQSFNELQREKFGELSKNKANCCNPRKNAWMKCGRL